MKAITIVKHGSAREAFEVREKEIPTPQSHELLVKVEAFGLNFADVMARKGLYQDAPPLPSVVGYEVVGRIEKLGGSFEGLEVGQRVVAMTRFGGYAEYAVTDARAAVVIPDDMPMGVAAALAVQYSTAWYCAEEMTRLHEGDHVLIQAAAGGVGTALVQIAKRRGCIVYGTAGSDEKLTYLKEQGVDYPINYRKQDFYEEVKKIRGNEGIDVAFDSLGGETWSKANKLLGSGGRIVNYGVAEQVGSGPAIWNTLKVMWKFGFFHPAILTLKSRGMIGVNMLRIADDRPETLKRVIQAVADLTAKGELKPQVAAEFTADQIAEAHEYLEGRKTLGKVVVKW